MDEKTQKNLLLAKEYCYKMRLVEAYNIFRRYYDRLPFEPSHEHAEYIGMFVRTLWDLGKDYDLKFYLAELEKLNSKMPSAAVSYQLGVVLAGLPEPRMEQAKKLFEDIVKNPEAKVYHAKAKMMLADYYDQVHGDVASCRKLIESIGDDVDEYMKVLVQLWFAKILRNENKHAEAEALLLKTLAGVDSKENWYAYFSGKLILTNLYIRMKRTAEAETLIEELKKTFEGKRFRTVLSQLGELDRLLREESGARVVEFGGTVNNAVIRHEKKTLILKGKNTTERLLVLFARRRFLKKETIVKDLFAKTYDSARDDKIIYYHVHSLRKKLAEIGLGADAISSEEDGYRFVPEVQVLKEEL